MKCTAVLKHLEGPLSDWEDFITFLSGQGEAPINAVSAAVRALEAAHGFRRCSLRLLKKAPLPS